MALIRCPECNTEVSDRAAACMRCGYPIAEYVASLAKEQPKEKPDPAPESLAEQITEESAPAVTEKPARRFNLKLLLIVILGSLFLVYFLISMITRPYIWDDVLDFLDAFFIPVIAVCAMLFCVLKKKIVSIILAAANLFFQLLTYIIIAIRPNYSTDVIGAILYTFLCVLLLLYAIFGLRKRNSLIWMILYLAIYLTHWIYMMAVFYIPRGFINSLSFMFYLSFLLEAGYFAIGYSPDKWYQRKAKPAA